MLDYIFVNDDNLPNMKRFHIVEDSQIFTSDHLPLIASFEIKKSSDRVIHPQNNSCITAWNKASEYDIAAYQNKLWC